MRGFFSSSTVQRDSPGTLIPRCGACGLYRTCKSPKMRPYGKGRMGILVVGEAPGQKEDEKGRPFIGKAGQHLRQVLGEIGIDLDRDAWTTNALICRPPKNKTPDSNQISHCRPNLLNTIREYQPQVVITLGRSALDSILPQYWKGDIGQMERWAGWRIPLTDFWLCPTFHPSYLLRMENSLMDRLFETHLTMAFGISTTPPEQPNWKEKVEVLYEEKTAYEAIRWFDQEGGFAAADYETNCLKPEWPEAKVFSCAISNGKRTIAYPWAGHAITATGMFLKSSRTRKIASNLKMEERWTLKEFGHGVSNWGWDTMLATHCLDNRPGICGLKFQMFVKMGVCSYNESIEPYLENQNGPYNRIGEISWKDLLLYNGMDALGEYKLAMIQRKEMGYE